MSEPNERLAEAWREGYYAGATDDRVRGEVSENPHLAHQP